MSNRRIPIKKISQAHPTAIHQRNPVPGARRLIQAMYNRYCSAFAAGDVEAIAALLAPDFEWKLTDGSSLNRAETLTAIEEQVSITTQVHRMTARVVRLALSGEIATAYVEERLVATVRNGDGNLERQSSEESYRDVWVKTSGGWMFKTAEVLASKTTAKPVVA